MRASRRSTAWTDTSPEPLISASPVDTSEPRGVEVARAVDGEFAVVRGARDGGVAGAGERDSHGAGVDADRPHVARAVDLDVDVLGAGEVDVGVARADESQGVDERERQRVADAVERVQNGIAGGAERQDAAGRVGGQAVEEPLRGGDR